MTKTTQTNTTTIANVTAATTVAEVRAEAAKAVFNIQAALAAAQSTPMCVRSATNGESRLGQVKAHILEFAKAIGKPFSLNQLDAALRAGGFEPKGRKELADVSWGLWKKGLLKKGDAPGIYEIA